MPPLLGAPELPAATAIELPRDPAIVITGAEGQLGHALVEVFPNAEALSHEAFDITKPFVGPTPDLILNAAAWTDVDGAEATPDEAHRVNAVGTRQLASSAAPLLYFSTDYVFDGRKDSAYVESDAPAPLSAYGRSKLAGEHEVTLGWVVRTSWLFGWTSRNFLLTMLKVGGGQSEVRVVDDQRGSPTYVGHLASVVPELLKLPGGIWHVAADGECTWADFAEAIFEEAEIECRVVRVSTDELGRPAPRPANSVLRSERKGAPRLPHWREGLRSCLARVNPAG